MCLDIYELFLKAHKELGFRHISNALQKAAVIYFIRSKKNLGNENSQLDLISFANLDSFLQVFNSHPVFIKLC